MTQTRSVLDDPPPPKPRWLGRAAAVLARLIKFTVAGAVVGAIIGHLLGGPVYLSRGYLHLDAPASQSSAKLAAPQQPLTLSIIATALAAAREEPAGASLPSSPSSALNHAAIEFGQTNDIVEISYRGSDPAAAGCMASQIIKAYSNALTSGIGGSPAVVTVIAMPVAGRPIRDSWSTVMYGLVGAGIGITLCAALAVLRAARP